ncbi:glycosyltransferase family 41 protein [Piedraia hortae CBS 480.64]|uniref:protein O-GlcNAc transferase n=1 Tax=Piedraia hortae CBS 480.64 TaxID=1314780 RepID=A0A6A7C2E3_9PEZI|nr:glycosyltransferase family 41 protein [Piedraia hortae CBS 480.64]
MHSDSLTAAKDMAQHALPVSAESNGPRAENSLRRKTPNGTLNAAYEATAENDNPQKHQLVLAEQSQKRTFREHQRLAADRGQWPQPPLALPADLMLYQRLPPQYYGQTIPTVIQPSFHYLGPTACGERRPGPYGPYWHDGTFVPYRPTAVRDPCFAHHPSMYAYPPQQWHQTWPAQPVTTFPQSQLSAAPLPPNANSRRDSVFACALQQYRELLAVIHHSKWQHPPPGRPIPPSRPAFYPPPPTGQGHLAARLRSSDALNGNFNGESYRQASYEQWQWTVRQSHTASVVPNNPYAVASPDPHVRAETALSHLTALCRDADWQWTDGVHLAGCLAYGLSYYQQAYDYYSKVLALEPDHLEARSNLAATVLALGRRREAEGHWMKVIRVAPHHFEAVEHLVGLLCAEHRSQDAIDVIEHVERALRQPADKSVVIYADNGEPGFGSCGFAIPDVNNGRLLALIHAKGNMLYGLGENGRAAKAFEEVVMIATHRRFNSIRNLIRHIRQVVSMHGGTSSSSTEPILLSPEQALITSQACFPPFGELPGLKHIGSGAAQSTARRAGISTTSNSLLSLAKIFQDGMSNSQRLGGLTPLENGVGDILALYYLSLSLQPSPSTANNVGILLAGVLQTVTPGAANVDTGIPGVLPGSGIALALQYYNYGLRLDQNHAHLYTNLGSLLKDIGQLDAAIQMYEHAVRCDPNFDIALANMANAVKDKGRIREAIVHYQRAVEVNPSFAEAVCGLANTLISVCNWGGRGGIADDGGTRDRWHVDGKGMLLDASLPGAQSSGWMKRVVKIVDNQLTEGEDWGCGTLTPIVIDELVQQLSAVAQGAELRTILDSWAGQKSEGARVTRLIERATRQLGRRRYLDTYVRQKPKSPSAYRRPVLPASLTVPSAPTVLPFHAFTCPLSAKQIRMISRRNGLRISVSALRAQWLPAEVYPPPTPPAPYLRVGYISSDFNNHPLAHLMQSVFGMHDRKRVKAYCYATTVSDGSCHRQKIEAEAPVFYNASSWSAEKLVDKIVEDDIHILVNLNGYTRGARSEVFAARPAPIQMSFMGFASTLGAEWCDYLLADETAIPPNTLRPWKGRDLTDGDADDNERWVYEEKIIYCRDTFFCCDHRQSAPDAPQGPVSWDEELRRRWKMRKEIFPKLPDDFIIFGNFNQLYKIEPTTFRTWLRILSQVPNSILWLLRFPDLGEANLLATAERWANASVASRIIFTDVAPKHLHISRARVCDLVLDTAECNAHTTAADVLWSGTPLVTLPRYEYKMCSRMAASILKGALPKNEAGKRAAKDLIAEDEEGYEVRAVSLAKTLKYEPGREGNAKGRLMDLRRLLCEGRWTSALFDTKRWVRDLEGAYERVWRNYINDSEGDIWLEESGFDPFTSQQGR